MKTGITHRLFLAILAAAGLSVISMVLIMQWSLDRGFLRFVNTMEKSSVSRLAVELEKHYRKETSWDFLRNDPYRWRQLIASSLPDEVGPRPDRMPPEPLPEYPGHENAPPPKPLPPPLARHFVQRLFLLDADKKVLEGQGKIAVDNEATPIRCNGQVVGYLGLLPRTKLSDAHQQRFMSEQKLAFILMAGVVVLLAAILSLLLATRLVRPLRELAGATHRLAAGEFSARVPVSSSDELGRLANDFNMLALTLEKNEQTRRQWVADISHELRTPLAVLRAEIEALQDGIRQPTPETIRSLHGEVLRLVRLVDDLYHLSLSDLGALTYRKVDLDLAQLLRESVSAYRPELKAKGILLADEIPDKGDVIVFADAERLHQLLANLFDNALKYTDNGGELAVRLTCNEGQVMIDMADSAPGVSENDLERLFDRLYRVDTSRNRAAGGAGLGLTICRNIVDAHAGTITAYPSPLGGVWIRISLPLAGSKP